ncbi:MurR/RpiR family transcriptional regulator [Oceanobacillus sp. FSL K6-2867]|uniref:MurR/RpiR family transcriptional regulator n=1 Tax=Oceanobacillus sp. FSL K6-2867 TaxID=2954748 RepID=UPI0030DB8297
MDDIYQKIYQQKNTFTNSLQKIASYILENPRVFAVSSATEAGKQIGVSETTIIRFCKQLGYNGYKELQGEVQNILLQKSSLSDYVEDKKVGGGTKNSIKRLMASDAEDIQKVMQRLSEENLSTAVTKLTNADRVFVAGVRSSHALASWFSYSLDLILGHTRMYNPGTDDILLRLSELTERSVFVGFSFHRYAIDTINIAKHAKNGGAFVIGITDSSFSPITTYCDLVLSVQLSGKSTLDVAPAVMSLSNSIIASISLENDEKVKERVKMFDSISGKDFFD